MDLATVGLFCFFYSGVVMYALWMTVAQKEQMAKAQVKNRIYK